MEEQVKDRCRWLLRLLEPPQAMKQTLCNKNNVRPYSKTLNNINKISQFDVPFARFCGQTAIGSFREYGELRGLRQKPRYCI